MQFKIPHIDLQLSTESFYCPVTGHRLFYPEYFDPSPALVFNYFDDYKEFNEATPEINKLYTECLKELNLDVAEDLIPFQKLVNEKLTAYHKQYLLLEIGDFHHNLFYCFDLLNKSENKLLDSSEPKISKISGVQEVCFNIELKELFCPVTGQILIENNIFHSSSALEFIYSHKKEGFELINNSLKHESLAKPQKRGYTILNDICTLLTEDLLEPNEHHFILTFGTLDNKISVCLDMSDPGIGPKKTFENYLLNKPEIS